LILITLGTQDKKFYRLLEAVQAQIDNKNIKDEVIVQAGCSCDFKTDDMKIFDLIPLDEFDELISKCDLLITHGGVGSIVTGLKNNKKVIAAPRLAKYGEHVNDHQLQIIENFEKSGYILGLNNFDELGKLIIKSKKFKPKKYNSNTENFNNKLEKIIGGYLGEK
jgi:UDP-N-acetylglucosamine transferase subunit ALG13